MSRIPIILCCLLTTAATHAADVVGLTLINATNDQPVTAHDPLTDGDEINLATLASTSLAIRADTDGAVGSVRLVLSGPTSHSQTESVAPYALFGDSSGDYDGRELAVGSYTLTATPYSQSGAKGTAGSAYVVSFTVIEDNGEPPPPPPPAAEDGDGSVTITGDLMQWHRVDLIQAARASEVMADPNPFRDYRFDVIFTAPSGTEYRVPGYFAGDGAGGDSGNLWMAHLNAVETGTWNYQVSFRSGSDLAASLDPDAGTAVAPFDGANGTFVVTASDKSGDDFRAADKGLLTNQGHHYLTYGGSGEAFVYTAPGIPENILGYRGFTNTTIGIGHEFTIHGNDWNAGDPDWNGGAGRALIGALNYIATTGGNGLYMMSNTIGGDGKDVFMHPTTSDKDRYDLKKLLEWDIALAHGQSLGLFLHWHLAEHESANMKFYGASLSVERRLYFRMLNARFGHYNGLKWNIMEETEWKQSERDEQMAWLRAIDPYDHPRTYQVGGIGIAFNTYNDHLGDIDIDAGSFQGDASRTDMFDTVQQWRNASAAAGQPWTIAWDEPQRIDNDNTDEVNGYPQGRRDKMWPCLMAGGDGFMWYIQKDGGGHGFDQRIEDFTIMANALAWSRHARVFLADLPLLQMTSSLDLVDSTTGIDYTLAQAGEVYAVYNDRAGQGMSLDLSGVSGTFSVQWFDPRNGGALQDGSVTSVVGGSAVELGSAPSATGQDWAVVVRRTGATPPPPPPVNQAPQADAGTNQALIDNDEDGLASVTLDGSASSDSDGSIVTWSWEWSGGTASEASPSIDLPVGTTDITLTVTDDGGLTDSDTVTIVVSAPPVAGDAWLEVDGLTVIEAELADHRAPGSDGDTWTDATDWDDYVGSGFVVVGPNDNTNHRDTANGAVLEFDIDFDAAGPRYVWVRMVGETGNDDSVHAGIDAPVTTGGYGLTDSNTGSWQWIGAVNGNAAEIAIAQSGVTTVRIWQREDGTRLDRILITDDAAYVPSGVGPAASSRGGAPALPDATLDLLMVTIQGHAAGEGTLTVTIDGDPVTVADDGSWTTTVGLPGASTHQVLVELVDGEGRIVQRTLDLIEAALSGAAQ